MKKVLKVSTIILALIATFTMTTVNAATGTVSLNASATTVKPGGSFNVTISAQSADGINGVIGQVEYDTNVLELDTANSKVTSNNWMTMAGATSSELNILCNTSETITEDDIYVLAFNVKDGVEEQETTITLKGITLDTFASTEATISLEPVSAKVSIEEETGSTETPEDPTDPEDPADPTDPEDPTDPTDPEDPADPTDPEDPSDPTDPEDPADPTDPEDPAGDDKKDDTTTKVELPATGAEVYALAIAGIIAVATISYIGYKKNSF